MHEDQFKAELDALKRKADESQRAAEEARDTAAENDFQRRIVNGRALQECIRSIIEPVLQQASVHLAGQGYTAHVMVGREKPHLNLPDETACAVEVVLESATGPDVVGRFGNRLAYHGDFSAQSLSRVLIIRDRTIDRGGPTALDAITTDLVQGDVLRFLGLVLVKA